jgi:hypothetical protein
MLLQVTKGVCIAARTLDGPQLSGRRTSRGTSGRSLRHALLATLRRVTGLLFVVIASHPVGTWGALGRRLLLLWSAVSVVALRRSGRAPGQTRDAISVKHLGEDVSVESAGA